MQTDSGTFPKESETEKKSDNAIDLTSDDEDDDAQNDFQTTCGN